MTEDLPGVANPTQGKPEVAGSLGFSKEQQEMFELRDRERSEFTQGALERVILAKTTNPDAVRYAFRTFAESMESATTKAPTLEDRYAAFQMYWLASSRAKALELGLDENKNLAGILELEKDGINIDLIPEFSEKEILERPKIAITPDMSGGVQALIAARNAEIEAENALIRKKNGEMEGRKEIYEAKQKEASKKRPKLIEALKIEATLFAARSKFNYQYSRYEASGGAVDQFAEGFLLPASWHLQPEDFASIFSATEMVESPENRASLAERTPEATRHLGNDIDLAIRAYIIVSLSDKPEELRALTQRPGWKIFGDNLPGGKDINYFIGNINSWAPESERHVKSSVNETREGKRGTLTMHGNIFAQAENSTDRKAVRNAVLEVVGGNRVAEELAYRMVKIFGIAAEAGAEELFEAEEKPDSTTGLYKLDKEKKGEKTVELEGFPDASDDLTKLAVMALYQEKQTGSGNPAGPLETRGKYEKLMVNFLKFAGYKTTDKDIGPKEETDIRSLWELMWGYKESQTTEGELLAAEPPYRLGELEWEKLAPDTWRAFMLRVFIAGRKEKGLYDRLTKVAWSPNDLANMLFWEEMNRDINIVVGNALAEGGQYRGKTKDGIKANVKSLKKNIKESFWSGVITTLENLIWLNKPGAAGVSQKTPKGVIEEFQRKAHYLSEEN